MGTAVAPATVPRVAPVVEHAPLQALGNAGDRTEVPVVALPLAGEDGVEAMMEVLVPHRVHAVPTEVPGPHHPRVVEVALGDEQQCPAGARRQVLCPQRHLLEDVHRRGVDDGVHGVDPQAIDVVVAEPHRCVVDEETADLVAVCAVEVDRLAPRRDVAGREVGTEALQDVACRPEVVVDHVEDRGEAPRVAGVDEALEGVWTAVRVVGGREENAVVSPPVVPRELVDRHDLHCPHAEVHQVVEPLDGGVEGALGREGPDMQLVDRPPREPGCGATVPLVIRPGERRVVDHARGPLDPLRLPGRAGVRQRL